MKQLMIPLLAGCAALLPISPLQAAGPPGKTYGGFSPGKTFTLIVTDRSSVRKRGLGSSKKVAVPNEWPDFKKGEAVKFTIGKKGQLKGPGFSIKYRDERGKTNFYYDSPSFRDTEGEFGTVKSSRNENPKKATLKFAKLSFSGIIPVTHTVEYEFKRNP